MGASLIAFPSIKFWLEMLEYLICEELVLCSIEQDDLSIHFLDISQTIGSFLSTIFFADFTVLTTTSFNHLTNNKRFVKLGSHILLEDHIHAILSLVQQQLPNEQNNQPFYLKGFDGIDLVYLLMNQISDFNGLFDSVLTADDFLELSNKESTDS